MQNLDYDTTNLTKYIREAKKIEKDIRHIAISLISIQELLDKREIDSYYISESIRNLSAFVKNYFITKLKEKNNVIN